MTVESTVNLKKPSAANEWQPEAAPPAEHWEWAQEQMRETSPRDGELPAPIPSDDKLMAMVVERFMAQVMKLDMESAASIAREMRKYVDNELKKLAFDRDWHAAVAREIGERIAKLNGILLGVQP